MPAQAWLLYSTESSQYKSWSWSWSWKCIVKVRPRKSGERCIIVDYYVAKNDHAVFRVYWRHCRPALLMPHGMPHDRHFSANPFKVSNRKQMPRNTFGAKIWSDRGGGTIYSTDKSVKETTLFRSIKIPADVGEFSFCKLLASTQCVMMGADGKQWTVSA